jgi:hypothetical protein
MQNILAIDPGTSETALLNWQTDPANKPSFMEIVPNADALLRLRLTNGFDHVYCEMVACYGMPVGKEVFETCLWIGQAKEVCESRGIPFHLVYRREIKMYHCGNMRAKDSNISQALRDKYGEPGSKKNPGILHGVKSHLWSALAIATYVVETRLWERQ